MGDDDDNDEPLRNCGVLGSLVLEAYRKRITGRQRASPSILDIVDVMTVNRLYGEVSVMGKLKEQKYMLKSRNSNNI